MPPSCKTTRGNNVKTVYQEQCGIRELASISLALLLYVLTPDLSASTTSLFDPERGAQEQGEEEQPVAKSSSSLQELRLDGILTLGDHSSVLISGPEGKTYRFSWQGELEKPMSFKYRGEPAAQLAGFQLASTDVRAVWLQLPSGTGCVPDPEQGIAACEEGRVKLAMIRRETPAPLQTIATNAERRGVQQAVGFTAANKPQYHLSVPPAAENRRGYSVQQAVSPFFAQLQPQTRQPLTNNPRSRNQSVVLINQNQNSDAAQTSQTQNQNAQSTSQTQSVAQVSQTQTQNVAQESQTQNQSVAQASQTQNQSTESSSQNQNEQQQSSGVVYDFSTDSPERAQLREEQQQVIDSAPPGWWGVK